MAFDGIMLSSIIKELQSKIIGGRIDRIYQPERDEIHIYIRANRQNYILLMSASPNFPRMHLTEHTKANPDVPPMFCMVLRKHLINGRIIDIEQPRFDRICHIKIESIDELGDISIKTLAIEIMGRHSNIILFNNDDKIIDSIKHIPDTVSSIRQVLPGKNYILPPGNKKQNPLLEKGERLKQLLLEVRQDDFSTTIFKNFMGISKLSANEIVYRALKNANGKLNFEKQTEMVCKSFIEFFSQVKEQNFVPTILKDEEGEYIDILPFIYEQFPLYLQEHYESPSKVVDIYYLEKDRTDRIKQHSSFLYKLLKKELAHNEQKLRIQREELEKAKDAEKYRLWGELIIANIYKIPEGTSKINLINYYDPTGAEEEISLDPNKTPAQNADIYFKRYTKLKNAQKQLSKQIIETENEIKYIESLIENLSNCTEEIEIEEIKEELIEEGYIKKSNRKKTKKKKKDRYSKPYHYLSSDGYDIYVGKNNRQNDYLTQKIANSNDIWLHVKDIPGSHVIIRTQGKKIPDSTLKEGAILAAYYSKGKNSSNVAVDYCLKRHVKKPSGAKPGMVIYDNYSTLYVTPKKEFIKSLKIMQ